MKTLTIHSGQGDYNVDFISGVQEVVQHVRAISKAVIVVDRKVAALYRESLGALFSEIPTLELDATEEEKSFVGVQKVCNWLQGLNCTKQNTVVTFGGGIIQDIVSFSAHIYYRGIKWVFVPTTLLSMSDSCIGAKSAINLNSFKNQLGCFYSPARALIATDFTKTLADQDVASGYGEILKLMTTDSDAKLKKLEASVVRGGLRNPEMDSLIYESLMVKKGVIEIDEYEKDLRRILNYGHTFGHALEAITHNEIPHGLGVAWGMDIINFISMKRGLLDPKVFTEIHDFISKHLPFRLSRKISASELVAGSKRDKKASSGKVNLILCAGPGNLKIVETTFDDALESQIGDYLDHHNVYSGS